MKRFFLTFLFLAVASIPAECGESPLTLGINSYPEYNHVSIYTGVFPLTSDVSFMANYHRPLSGAPTQPDVINLSFFTHKSTPVWSAYESLQASYAGKKINLYMNPGYTPGSSDGQSAEMLLRSVPLYQFRQMVVSKKVFFTIKGASYPVYGVTIEALRGLLDSIPKPTKKIRATNAALNRPIVVRLSSHQRASASAALRALRRLESATKVGINQETYNNRVIDAQSEVDEGLRSVPSSALKQKIQSAMRIYANASALWPSYSRIDALTEGDSASAMLSQAWGNAKAETRDAERMLGN